MPEEFVTRRVYDGRIRLNTVEYTAPRIHELNGLLVQVLVSDPPRMLIGGADVTLERVPSQFYGDVAGLADLRRRCGELRAYRAAVESARRRTAGLVGPS